MIRFCSLFLLHLVLPLLVIGQITKNSADCEAAVALNLPNRLNYYKENQQGYGEKMEVSSYSLKNKHFFEKEHNSTWYKFSLPENYLIQFDIIPDNPKDDYDFLLFEYQGDNFCRDLQEKKVLPIRSNIARNTIETKGVTGLKKSAKKEIVASGPGENFSKHCITKSNAVYYLVLDNVYNDQGHTLIFDIQKQVSISGLVTDSESKIPLEAKIEIRNIYLNKVVETCESNKKGAFYLCFNPDFNNSFQLTIAKKGYFHEIYDFTPKELKDEKKRDLSVELYKIKEGGLFRLKNINFKSGSPELTDDSKPSLDLLLKFMKDNPSIKIEIGGHTNGNTSLQKEAEILPVLKLSRQRAITVEQFLIRNGIEGERIISKGYAGNKNLFPSPKNNYEQMQNRRVEILILKL